MECTKRGANRALVFPFLMTTCNTEDPKQNKYIQPPPQSISTRSALTTPPGWPAPALHLVGPPPPSTSSVNPFRRPVRPPMMRNVNAKEHLKLSSHHTRALSSHPSRSRSRAQPHTSPAFVAASWACCSSLVARALVVALCFYSGWGWGLLR